MPFKISLLFLSKLKILVLFQLFWNIALNDTVEGHSQFFFVSLAIKNNGELLNGH